MLKFTNSEVEKKFEPLVDKDRLIHKLQVYSGLLSNITPAVAESLVKGGSNLLKEKSAKAVQPAKE